MKTHGTVSFLFLGGAKRVTMARMFRQACADRGLECRITGYELDAHSALAAEGDIVEGLHWSDPDIFNDLDRVCDKYKVDVVVPFVDGAIGIASQFAAMPQSDVFFPGSPRDIADRMFDKVAAAELFETLGLPIPQTYHEGMPCGCLIAKPRFGSASKGIITIDTLSELYALRGNESKYLIQERIDRREEITVDCYVGVRTGEIVAVSPRIRGEVSGGEAVRSETIDDPQVVSITKKILSATQLRGAVTVQFIRDLDNGRILIMEINPRLGGGAVTSVHASVDLPGLIIDDALGLPLKTQTPVAGVETVRYLADVVFYPEKIKK